MAMFFNLKEHEKYFLLPQATSRRSRRTDQVHRPWIFFYQVPLLRSQGIHFRYQAQDSLQEEMFEIH